MKKTNPFGAGSTKKPGQLESDKAKINEQRLKFSFLKAEAAQNMAKQAS